MPNRAELDAIIAMGIDPSTLPEYLTKVAPRVVSPRKPQVNFTPLTDEEWQAVEPHLPALPVPKATDFDARVFLDSVVWWEAARKRGWGWGRLPDKFWPVSSREHRHRRWCELGWWTQLADALRSEALLSDARLRTFMRIASDAEARRARLRATRERLTGKS